MSGAPRVSVLLPVRDAASTLECALESVRRQTERSFECVVVDDGSRDASLPIVRRFAARDARFRVLARGRRGLLEALAAGFGHCRAPLVARMDADDLMQRTRLAKQCDALDAAPSLAGVGCHVRIFPRRARSEGMRAYEAWLVGIDSPERVRTEAFVECPLAHPTLVLRRPLLAQLGWRNVGWPEDYDLVLRALAAGHRLGVVTEPLLFWRDGPGRLSRTHPRYAQERFTACKAAHLAAGFLRDAERYRLWGYGGTGRALRRALAVHGRHPSHVIELHPGRLGNRIHGAPVIPPPALAELPRAPLVVSVAGAGPRARIRAALAQLGFAELDDYVCAA